MSKSAYLPLPPVVFTLGLSKILCVTTEARDRSLPTPVFEKYENVRNVEMQIFHMVIIRSLQYIQ